MDRIVLLLLLIGFLVAGCENNEAPATIVHNSEALSPEDSIYKAVIALHDEAMPKMGKLMGYEKVLQQKIDSLEDGLKKHRNDSSLDFRMRFKTLLTQVKEAQNGMNNWMDSFDPDPKIPNKEDLMAYWEDQRKSAKKMRDDVMNAVDSFQLIVGP